MVSVSHSAPMFGDFSRQARFEPTALHEASHRLGPDHYYSFLKDSVILMFSPYIDFRRLSVSDFKHRDMTVKGGQSSRMGML